MPSWYVCHSTAEARSLCQSSCRVHFGWIMQMNDGTTATVEPNSNEVVTSREDNFVFKSSTRTESVKTRQDDRATTIRMTRSGGLKFPPNSTVQYQYWQGSILPWVSWRQRISNFSAIVWRFFIGSRNLWLDAAEPKKPRGCQVQIRSPFAWRQLVESVSCTEMLLVFNASAFHRQSSR